MATKLAKNTLWAYDGRYYGRVASYPEPQDFLAAVYRGEGGIDDDHKFLEGWKEGHPLETFIEQEEHRVTGAFELWEWER